MLLYVGLFWVLLLAAAMAAARWGGRPEQAVAAMYVAAALLSLLARPAQSQVYRGVELRILLVDLLLLLGLTIVALRADRWWPIGSAAIQAISTLSHVARGLNPHLWRLGYELMAELSAYPTVILLLIGIWRHHRRTLRSSLG